MPASFVTVWRATFVAVLVRVTFTFGMTAEPASVTVPRTVLLLACGQAMDAQSSTATERKK